MQPFPPLPAVADAPEELFERGHLWIQELVVGAPLRFSVAASGRVAFGDRRGPLADPPPPSLGYAIRHVREHVDRDRLHAVADDPSNATFFGVATRFEGVPYDWARLPGFLGTDVWSGDREAYLAPDAVERVVDALGLVPVNAVEKEVETAYFEPGDYAVPDSAWYDGPAAGVVFRNKRGDRAALRAADVAGVATPPEPEGAASSGQAAEDAVPPDAADAVAALVERTATPARVEQVAAAVASGGRAPTVDAVRERLVETVAREEYTRLPDDLDWARVRSVVGERVARALG